MAKTIHLINRIGSEVAMCGAKVDPEDTRTHLFDLCTCLKCLREEIRDRGFVICELEDQRNDLKEKLSPTRF